MLDDYGFEIYEENPFPLAYLLTFRTYGTWLHGDERGSIQRRRNESSWALEVDPNVPLRKKMSEEMSQEPTILNIVQRKLVETAFFETCEYRDYDLKAANIRSNHAHAVISKWVTPEKIVNDLKAYSTKETEA